MRNLDVSNKFASDRQAAIPALLSTLKTQLDISEQDRVFFNIDIL